MSNLPSDPPPRLWLSPEELEELTQRKQPAAQARVLSNSVPPIPYIMVDGRPIVRRSEVFGSDNPPVTLNWE